MGKKRQRKLNRKKISSHEDRGSPKESGRSLTVVHEIVLVSVLICTIFLVYSNTLNAPFVFDDGPNIQNNPHIRLNHFTLKGMIRAGFKSYSSNRPIANISFALNYYFQKYHVVGFHVVNILIHAMTALFFYLLVRLTLNLPSVRYENKYAEWIPFFVALIWAVHPIQTQSVTYIVQRMNSMAVLFYILSLYLYTRARIAESKCRKGVFIAGCTVAGLLSVGSKEIAFTLPMFIFLYEWYFFQELRWSWVKRHSYTMMGLLILILLIVFLYLGVHPLEVILATYKGREFTLTERVLTQFRVVIFYLTLIIFPHPARLNLDHDFPISHSLMDPFTTTLSIVAVTGMVALSLAMAKKKPLISFCIIWFLGNLIIESSVIGLELAFEHRNYLPSTFMILLGVTLIFRHIKSKKLGIGILCGVAGLYSIWTYERNMVWKSRLTLWTDCMTKSPQKARPHSNLGITLWSQGNDADAVKQYLEALRIDPNYADAHLNLGVALKQQGRVEEAMHHYHEAIRINPNDPQAHNNLGNALLVQGRVEEAMRHFSKTLELKPTNTKARYNLGTVLAKQGRFEEAIEHLTEALRIDPEFASAHHNLGLLLKQRGRIKEAKFHLSEAHRIRNDQASHYPQSSIP